MREDRARFAETGAGQHRWPEERVKVEDVLADKMEDFCIAALFPEFFEIDAFPFA